METKISVGDIVRVICKDHAFDKEYYRVDKTWQQYVYVNGRITIGRDGWDAYRFEKVCEKDLTELELIIYDIKQEEI